MSGVARRPKIGAEISISVSVLSNRKLKERVKFRCQIARPHVANTQVAPKSFPDGKTSIEGRKDNKAAKQHCTSAPGEWRRHENEPRAGYALGVHYEVLPQT